MDQEKYCQCSRPDLRDISEFLCLSCGLETNFSLTQPSCEHEAEDVKDAEIVLHEDEREIPLDPDKTPFRYDKLQHAAEFRLVRLFPRCSSYNSTCEVFHADISDPPQYEAVSYTWGRSRPTHKLHTTKGSIMVTPNCLSALRDLRHPTRDRILWVDSVCIAQNDALEKNHQIPLMGRIYAGATCVMIHLGHAGWEHKSEYIRNLFKLLRDGTKVDDWLGEQLTAILSRPWFSRIWVLQEVAMARRAVAIANSSFLDWQYLSVANIHVVGREPIDYGGRVPAVLQMPTSNGKPLRDLASLITTARSCLSSDPRDRIYALLGLVDERSGVELVPDYTKAPKEVYTDVAVQFLRVYNNLDFLADIEMAGPFSKAITSVSIEESMRQLPRIQEFTVALERTIKELEFGSWLLPFSLPKIRLQTLQTAADVLVQKAGILINELETSPITNHDILTTFAKEIKTFFSGDIGVEYAHEARNKCQLWKRARYLVGICSNVLKKEISTSFMQTHGTCLTSEYYFWPMPSKRENTKVVMENLDLPCWVPDYRYHPMLFSLARSHWNWKPYSLSAKVVARFHACSQSQPRPSLEVRTMFVQNVESTDCKPGDMVQLCGATMRFPLDSAFDNFSQYFGESLVNMNHGATVDDIRKFVQGRRLAWTEKSLAIVPANFKLGDVIAVLYGGTVPYLLRPDNSSPGRFQLIGECYLHGMKGPQFAPNYAELLGYFKDYVKLGAEDSGLGDLKDLILRDGKVLRNAKGNSPGSEKTQTGSKESEDHAARDMQQDGLPWQTIFLQ